jgi:[acyl-carrier-protein] S-malonyltransferase
MTQKKKRLMVICPGRGSYLPEIQPVLSLYQNLPPKEKKEILTYLERCDQRRSKDNLPTISELDQTPFKPALHTLGEHASMLIAAFSMMDFQCLLQQSDRYEVVVIIGNSMGWYITLSCAGALNEDASYRVIQTMGSMMKHELIGGQILYPLVNDEWQHDTEKEKLVLELMNHINQQPDHECYLSILLGGFIVIGGNEKALKLLQKKLPAQDRYPMRLMNHAAFHTPMLNTISERAFKELPNTLLQKPHTPMIDGRGVIWNSYNTSLEALYDYTFHHQVVAPYDFSRSLEVGLKEFAPDQLVLLGPGNTLGGAIAHVLIQTGWQGIRSKQDFVRRQKENPLLLSMGRPDQRHLV